MDTTHLAEFLLARIEEDEAAMRAVLGHNYWADGQSPPTATTPMARVFHWTMTPARVIAECDAKRRILAEHEMWQCPTLCYLALPYADHPDYREEWRA